MNTSRILLIPIMAVALISCSSSGHDEPDTPDTPLLPISFGSNSGAWQDAPSSRSPQRASRASGNNGLESLYTTFRAWGYKTTAANATQQQLVMDGYKVAYITDGAGSTESNTNGWEYVGISNENLTTAQTIKFWDYSATTYRFFGYSPFNAKATVANTTSSFDGVSTPVVQVSFPFEYSDAATATSIPYTTDLWLAQGSSSPTGSSSGGSSSSVAQYGSCVTLTFAPIISKVRFRFTYPDGTDEITMTDIKFCDSRFVDSPETADTPLAGNIAVAYPLTGIPKNSSPQFSWTEATGTNAKGLLLLTTPYEEENASLHITPQVAEYEKWYYVPPLNIVPYEQSSYTVSARINGQLKTAVVPAAFMQWKAGYQYTYIFKINDADATITFTDLQVEQWLPGTNFDNQGSGTEQW